MTGCFSSLFRTGGEKGTHIEVLLESLNSALGTAYAASDLFAERNITWVENMAIARALCDLWESNRRLACQWDPLRMSVFISRWEAILGIIPDPSSSQETRKSTIGTFFSIWTKPPTIQHTADFLKLLIPDIFVDLEFNIPGSITYYGTLPLVYPDTEPLTLPGGTVLHTGAWTAKANYMKIRIWQPRDHANNLLMKTNDYKRQIRKANKFLDNYLPSYMTFHTLRYVLQGPGTISTTLGSNAVVGVSTTFTTTFYVGQQFESVDNDGIIRSYTIANIADATHLTITTTALSDNTDGFYRLSGFKLDTPANLDNNVLR